ncbi:MAG TPA: hypothetical protein DCZ63_07045 [Geobacter sp.]|nr:hypothetical protein [Geobacter sp.]
MSHENYSRNDQSTSSSDRSFGLVFAALFFCIAVSPILSGAPPRYWSVAVSGSLVLLSLLKPSILTWLNRCWTTFGRLLHRLFNPLVLAALFFLVITPYALVMRMFRKDQLGLTREPSADSYWQKRTARFQNMKRQF